MAAQYNMSNHTVTELYPSTQHHSTTHPDEIREPGASYDVERKPGDPTDTNPSALPEQTEEPFSIALLEFYDSLYGVFSANEFYFQCVEAIANDCQLDISADAKFGLMRNARWLKRQQNAILERLEHIRKAVLAAEK